MRTLKPGELFDNQYKLIQLIDTGGFADVWKANHLAAKDHIVALKVYPMLDVEGVKNIENEYDNQKDLSHTHLLTAKHFGKDADGHPYLVMRYCSAGNGSHLIGKCNEKEIANIMYQVSSALAYLHEEDLVHQDIKPNNILIDERDGKEYIFLADLGLSLKVRNTIKKFTESKRSNSNSIQTGVTPPPYRALELWGKDNLNRDPIKATDIWAFGATLFELIAGDVPFGEFGGLNQKNDPEPPSLPTDFQRECNSDDLNYIIQKCLSINPWDRPKAQELALWANNFLTTGKWSVNKFVPLTGSGHSSGSGSSAGSGLYADSGYSNGTRPGSSNGSGLSSGSDSSADPKDNNVKNIIKWVVIIALGFLTAFGIDKYVDSKKTQTVYVEPNLETPTDEPGNKGKSEPEVESKSEIKTASEVKPIEKETKPVAIVKNKLAEPTTSNTKKALVTPVNPPVIETGIVNNPAVDKYPASSEIRITNIRRTANNLTVSFLLKRGEGQETASYAIYGPEKPYYAFYIKAGGQIYDLVSMQNGTNGESVKWGSRQSHVFTAIFPSIPSNVMTIDIKEAKERSDGESYWDFKGVHLPKQSSN